MGLFEITKLSSLVSFPWLPKVLLLSSRFPSKVVFTQDPSLHRHYSASLVLWSIWLPGHLFDLLAFTLVRRYCRSFAEWLGSPTFTYILWLHAVLSDPGDAMYHYQYRFTQFCLLVIEHHRPSLLFIFTRLNHFSSRLRPTTSLSTLSAICHQIALKTRYEMCLVALSR